MGALQIVHKGEVQTKREVDIDIILTMSAQQCVQVIEHEKVLAVARRNLNVEILNPFTGALCSEVNVNLKIGVGLSNSSKKSEAKESAALIGVHLFRNELAGSRSVLTCTDSGAASLQQCNIRAVDSEQSHDDSTAVSWAICQTGTILCMEVDGSEKFAAFGGDGAEVTLHDIQSQSKIWEAKAPRRDNNGLMSRPFVTASTFLGNDHRKLVVGTGHHQVRLYDVGAMRRPVMAFDFLESPIKAVEADTDGNTVFVGTGNGDLVSFDMRSGKLLGSFKGRISGSIRSIAVHPTLPVIGACGLDRFLRIFHKSTRQLLARIFLKQPLVATVFDTKYPIKLPAAMDDAERPLGKFIVVKEPEKDGQRSLVKKLKTRHIEVTEDQDNPLRNGAEDFLPASGTADIRRKPKKRRRREALEMSERKKDDSSSLGYVFEQVDDEDQTGLIMPHGQPGGKEEPVTKLRKTKKVKGKA
ncbi:hypothetical protein L7F22_006698 [Adiantum nelumboides]|nr:hypothetical protein [Adiantum nelumboides]